MFSYNSFFKPLVLQSIPVGVKTRQEPTTRRPFSLVQLADLDALAARAGAKVKGSLVKSYNEGQSKYRERRERRYSSSSIV